ncbi:MAG: GGDEF domain-containing protein [Lachnospiraceae bacterium]|nr:GGDEF domain-containing protein [Lachnospiraceae bacterium]
MEQKGSYRRRNSEYEALHKTVIIAEGFRPGTVIIPLIIINLIIVVMSVYTYIHGQKIIDNAEQIINQMAEYIAVNIANDMDYAESSIKFASFSISQSMTSGDLENPAGVISPIVENTPFGAIEYIQPDGMNVMNIGQPFDASDRIYYIEGMKGNTGVWNNFHPKTSKETLMNFYTPLLYQGEIAGVLTGYIAATTQIAPLFEKKLYGQDIYGLLVDENDMVVCSTFDHAYTPDLTLDLLMEQIGILEEERDPIKSEIHRATETAVFYDGPSTEGSMSVVKIPETEWVIAILVPASSLNAIVRENTRASVITIFIISGILILYAAAMIIKSVKRRKVIAKENEKLEEENRVFNEENRRAFREISAIRDIIASAAMGTWRIELVDGKDPRMFVDDTMKMLLGIPEIELTPEETYERWFHNIVPQAVASVLVSVEKMKEGRFDENTYLWRHPWKGERYVRCGGTAQEIPGGFLLGGYHYDVDEVVREDLAKVAMLREALDEKNDYYNTLGTLADIYNSLHVIDLKENTLVEFSAKDKTQDSQGQDENAAAIIRRAMTDLATDESRDRALEFTDLETLAERMQDKKYIATQLISNRIGWFLASFITLETDADGKPVKVIFTTQSIDEEKKQEEKLIHRTRTDELTGLLNRRAYEEDFYEQNDVSSYDHFVFMSLDVNGLKVVNDSLGHAAGDELLVGASDCMVKSLRPYGQIYRTGGDEFIAILFCDDQKLKEVLADFDQTMAGWKGKLVEGLTISYGYISKEEEPHKSVRELAGIADKRMYEAKAAHYRRKGVDRRGHQDAHRALCELYTKILKINITEDTCQIVNMDPSEQTAEKGFSDKLSAWISGFGTTGQVHPEDLETYLEKTDLQRIGAHFAKDKTAYRVFYRRKLGDEFHSVMMEIIPANDYSDTNQSLYLYVKMIDR